MRIRPPQSSCRRSSLDHCDPDRFDAEMMASASARSRPSGARSAAAPLTFAGIVVDHPRPGSGRARRRVLSIVVPQGDDALDTQEWDSEQPGQETDLDQHGGRRSAAEPDVAVSVPFAMAMTTYFVPFSA